MRRFEAVELLPFRPEQVFDLVVDVAAYPRFLPWVRAARVSRMQESPEGLAFVGEAVVGFKAFSAGFSTHVLANRAAGTISTGLISGPFRHLDCLWRFNPSPSGALVEVRLDFEFSEPVLTGLLSANMQRAVKRLIEAFTAEAERRYQCAGATGPASDDRNIP